ncbi:MAG: hypothetical protein ABJH68_14430 [Ilumatobacter sp.]|uniref:hypothetical protein n=1 Tax=Ilumatobacter sp. TaxID=1967498 RepID=UPI00329831C9
MLTIAVQPRRSQVDLGESGLRRVVRLTRKTAKKKPSRRITIVLPRRSQPETASDDPGDPTLLLVEDDAADSARAELSEALLDLIEGCDTVSHDERHVVCQLREENRVAGEQHRRKVQDEVIELSSEHIEKLLQRSVVNEDRPVEAVGVSRRNDLEARIIRLEDHIFDLSAPENDIAETSSRSNLGVLFPPVELHQPDPFARVVCERCGERRADERDPFT